MLKKQCAKITKIKEKPTNPADIIQLFVQQSGQLVTLQDLHIKKRDVHLTLSSSTTEQIVQYIQYFAQQKLFDHVEIVSIEPTEQLIKTTVHAIVAH